GKSDLMDFIKFPNQLYKHEKFFVPYLNADRKKFLDKNINPFFQHSRGTYYLAYKDGKLTGRIAAFVNDFHNQYHNEKIGFFGFFDCIDDLEVASALMSSAEKYVKNEGMEIIRGPMNFSTNDEIGLLIEGFDSYPCFMMTWNPPYYLQLYEKLGLTKIEDVFAYYIDDSKPPSERIQNIVEKTKARSRITLRTLNMKDFDNELKIIRIIYNAAWSKNWGFVPMTPEEFQYLADDLKKIVDPELVLLAFVDGEPAGFSLAMPDYNPVFKKMNSHLFPIGFLKFFYYTRVHRLVTGARILTLGIVHKYQKIGLDMVLFYETFKGGPARGYHWGEMSWILERNVLMNKGAVTMGGHPYKKYRIFDKQL
ncbi:MAG TPA: hypothetical protein DCZ43_11555, partial [candidate division Zixibacteria bacterium]|nr:hypothetical protein [candidate division Zixibacteria bacterium]